MKTFFRCAALAPLLALVAGCCANNANNCDDLQADSLFLVLANNRTSADTVNVSFTRSELDTVYIQRYSPAATPVLSTAVSIIRRRKTVLNSALAKQLVAAKLDSTTLVISNTSPFSPSVTGGKLNAYNYLLTIQDKATKTRPIYQYYIENIVLQGQYEADGCTTCYQNTKKTFRLRGKVSQENDVTEKGSLVAVTITKAN